MKPLWAVLRARFQTLLQYRAAAAAGLGTQLFWGLIRVMILAAFYRSSTASQPLSLAEVVDYVWLSQALFMLLPWRSEPEAESLVRTGNVAYELLRPVDLYALWFARSLAFRTAPTLLRAIPLLVVAYALLGLRAPASLASFAAWLAAMLGVVLLSSALTTLMTITLLWTISGRGISMLLNASMWVLSGMILPLPLFPDWAQPVLELLPFRGLIDAPLRLYFGHIPASEAGSVMAHQLVWALILIVAGRLLMARGTRRLVVQGG